MVHDPFGLGHRELTQRKERLARARRHPVGIAAPCIQKSTVGFSGFRGCQLNQFILDLKRAERLVIVQLQSIHGSNLPGQLKIRTTTIPKMVSNVLPMA